MDWNSQGGATALPEALPHPALDAVVHQLSHTVHQLVLAAVQRARQQALDGELPLLPPPGSVLAPVPAPPRPSALPTLQAPWLPPALPAAAAGPAERLSAREGEVLQALAGGHSNKVIARALGLSPHTVKRHVANILDKLGLHSRGQAVAWWMTQQAGRQGH